MQRQMLSTQNQVKFPRTDICPLVRSEVLEHDERYPQRSYNSSSATSTNKRERGNNLN